jgi:peptide/nickel transport system permease protein
VPGAIDYRWLGRRVAGAAVTLAAVAVFNFFLFRVMGDPTSQLARIPGATAAEVTRLKAELGLNQPLFPGQFLKYLDDLAHFNLGIGQQTREPVSTLVLQALPWTLLLVGTATVLAALVGTWMGVRAAEKRGRRRDTRLVGLGLASSSAPEYWTGILLILLFAVLVPIFPAGQQMTPGRTFSSPAAEVLDVIWHLTLPALALAFALLGPYVLIVRSSMVEVLGEDFITAKRALGIRRERVLIRHGLRNALLPVVTLGALQLGFVVGGAVTIETLFSWPGLGQLTYTAIQDRDYPVLQGTFLVFAVAVIVANLLADVLYFLLDPRVQHR